MKLKNREGVSCPCCENSSFRTKVIACNHCDAEIRSDFEDSEFSRLNKDDLHFLRVFINCEGKLKDMEKALGISYPSVKNKLSRLKESLSTKVKDIELNSPSQILEAMNEGELSYEQGLSLLKKIKN